MVSTPNLKGMGDLFLWPMNSYTGGPRNEIPSDFGGAYMKESRKYLFTYRKCEFFSIVEWGYLDDD